MAIFKAMTVEIRDCLDLDKRDPICGDCRIEVDMGELFYDRGRTYTRRVLCASCYHKRSSRRIEKLSEDLKAAQIHNANVFRELHTRRTTELAG